MATETKHKCYLCNYETTDTVDLYGMIGTQKDYLAKIRKYLYLLVQAPVGAEIHSICWMCSQQLEAFHLFYTKINELQKTVHKELYAAMSLSDPVPAKDSDDNVRYTVVDAVKEEHSQIIHIQSPNQEDNIKSESPQEDDRPIERSKRKRTECDQEPRDQPARSTEPVESAEQPAKKSKTTDSSGASSKDQAADERHPGSSEQAVIASADQQSSTAIDETPVKRGRGRPKGSSKPKTPKPEKHASRLHNHRDLPKLKVSRDDSVDEFPHNSIHADAEQWTMSMETFPSKILKDGLLLYKGRTLMSMVCKFYTLECDLCEDFQRFEDLHELFSHYSQTHKKKGYVNCCNTQISTYSRAIMHMAKHLQPDAFKCETCGYVVARPKFLESHRKTHLPDDEKPFCCFICKRTFCWKTALLSHMITHQPPEERKKHVCHVCGKVYDNQGSLSTHKKLQHTNRVREVLVCDICAKNFSTRAGLIEHKATIHQPREVHQIQCTICSQWCMNKRCLKTHMLLHSDIRLECTLCEYTTRKKTLLKRHHLTKHSDERPFQCDQCDKAFKTKHSLIGHVRQAHGEQTLFACNFCDRTFRSSTNFYTHRKLQHPVELEQMRKRAEKEKRLARIEAGVEDVATNENDDGDDGDDDYHAIEIEIIPVKDDEDEYEEDDEEEGDKGETVEIIDWHDDD